jgi:hypothetical protein
MLTAEEKLFAAAVRSKVEKYTKRMANQDGRVRTALDAAMKHLPALIAGFEKEPPNKQLIRDKISLLIQNLKAWKPKAHPDALVPIPNKDDVRPAVAWRQLIDRGDGTLVIRSSGKGPTRPAGGADVVADGSFCFAILVAKPTRVLVTERSTGGHTTLTNGADVFYAGELTVQGGRLVCWNNDSGHYKPDEKLSAQVGYLLPTNKFVQRPS